MKAKFLTNDRNYERITSMCLVVALVCAMLYDTTITFRWLIIVFGLISAIVAVSMYFLRQKYWVKSVTNELEDRNEASSTENAINKTSVPKRSDRKYETPDRTTVPAVGKKVEVFGARGVDRASAQVYRPTLSKAQTRFQYGGRHYYWLLDVENFSKADVKIEVEYRLRPGYRRVRHGPELEERFKDELEWMESERSPKEDSTLH